MNTTTNFRHTMISVTKKVAVAMALLLTLGTSYAFAGAGGPVDEVSGEIKVSFSRNFKGAALMSTEAHDAFTKLTFKMNEVVMSAFYSKSGELLAVTRNILSTQLPMDLMLELKNKYSAYWITELFEFTGSDDSNCYYVSLENADQKVTLRSNVDGWEVYTTTVKK